MRVLKEVHMTLTVNSEATQYLLPSAYSLGAEGKTLQANTLFFHALINFDIFYNMLFQAREKKHPKYMSRCLF